MEGRIRHDTDLCDELASGKTKQITTVYARRNKDYASRRVLQESSKNDQNKMQRLVPMGKENVLPRGVREVTKGQHHGKQRRQSWIDRSLSLRLRRRSLVHSQKVASCTSTGFDSFHSLSANNSSSKAYLGGRMGPPCEFVAQQMQRKKRIEAPKKFVEQQQAMFAEIDAFDLEEAVPSPIHSRTWVDDISERIVPDITSFHALHAPLQAVPEDTSGEQCLQTPSSHVLSKTRHLLVAALTTPGHAGSLEVSGSDHTLALQEKMRARILSGQRAVVDHCSLSKAVHSEGDQQCSTGNVGIPTCSLVGTLHTQPTGSGFQDVLCSTGVGENRVSWSSSSSARPQSMGPAFFTSGECSIIGQHAGDIQENECYSVSNTSQATGLMNNASVERYVTSTFSFFKEQQLVGARRLSFSRPRVSLESVAEMGDSTSRESPIQQGMVISPLEGALNIDALTAEVRALDLGACMVREKREQCSAILEEDETETIQSGSESVRSLEPPLNISDDEDFPSVYRGLLRESNQTQLLSLTEAISFYCDLNKITKIGEGTFGEAFKEGDVVLKIVPVDGEFRINGEIQKTCTELYDEVLLSRTLNKLHSSSGSNLCSNFITTKGIKFCRGKYDANLVRAWEEWDSEHSSENDHPMIFPEHQRYVVFILADGGRDLESFVLSDFEEVQSLLLQVALSLAVAERECEFEHRDLHWGNVVLVRNKDESNEYCLDGRQLKIRTSGLCVSIIDFTLSRVNTGKQVLFCDLGVDPGLFEGPTKDVQTDTYRGMFKLTGGHWEGRFPKTNVLWIHYLTAIILNKKSFSCTTKQKRDLRSFRKRVLQYDSATVVPWDDFFHNMWIPTLSDQ